MIKAHLSIDNEKIIDTVSVKGHSGLLQKGQDIVCAAVSVLINTAHLTFKNILEEDIELFDNNDILKMKILNKPDEKKGEMRGATIFLVIGLKAINRDYIKNFELKITEK